MTGAPSLDLREARARSLLRWGACLTAVLMAHGAIAAALLRDPPVEAGVLPPSPIMIDLQPAATPMASIEDVSKLLPDAEPPPPVPQMVRSPVMDMLPTPQPPPEVKIEVTIKIPPPEPPPPEVKIEIVINIPPPEVPPPVDLKPPEKVVKKPPPKPPEKVPVKRAGPSRAPPSAAPAAATASGAPSPSPPSPVLQPNPRAMASWRGLLFAHLARHKRYPRASQSRGDEGIVYVRFTVTRQGMVTAQRIERASGHQLLDLEAADVLRRAQPLPAPPADMPGDAIEVIVPFAFNLR